MPRLSVRSSQSNALTILLLWRVQQTSEEGERLQHVSNLLFKDIANVHVRDMHLEVDLCMWQVLSQSGGASQGLLDVKDCLFHLWCPGEVSWLGLAQESMEKWACQIGCSRDKLIIKVDHADKHLKSFEGDWSSKLANGGNFLRKWEGTLCINLVPKGIYVANIKLAFIWVKNQAMLLQKFKKLARWSQFLVLL